MTSSSIELEYNEINAKNLWLSLFQEIREKCDREAKDKLFSIMESGKNQNRQLNRYRDVNPYDHSRIVIRRGKTDYINANLVKMDRADKKYILTQGPLRETVGHFWLMIWEQNTKAILMLNKLLEKNQIKCHMYWPERIGEDHILNLNDVGLSVEYLKCEEYTNFSKRIFRLTDIESKKGREIVQFHYTTWPDFGIPSSPVAFLQFLKQVRDSGALEPEVGPAVVHCSAGIGRSGTFCLVDCCLVLIDKEGENKVSVQDILYELRRYRMGLIQTADQLYFSYQAIIEGIKLLKDPSFNDYEEVPRISKEEQAGDNPPPLPPRTHSLQSTTTTTASLNSMNKPLPTIPNSESLHEDFISTNNENFVDYENNSINRPLPPLPQQNSLEKVAESDSEEDNDNDDDDDDIDDDDEDDNNNSDSNDERSILQNGNENVENHNNSTLSDKQNKKDEKEMCYDDNEIKKLPQNGMDKNINIDDGGESAELRRRKRLERQSMLEKKVNEIKRKQREVEETSKSSKKRRSLIKYLAAGVLVGVLCVYAYTKFG